MSPHMQRPGRANARAFENTEIARRDLPPKYISPSHFARAPLAPSARTDPTLTFARDAVEAAIGRDR